MTGLKRAVPRPKFRGSDRWLWVLLSRCRSDWRRRRVILQPRTVVGWHRLSFRLFGRWKSHTRGNRPSVARELITLLRRLGCRNPAWGSKRLQAELAKLGIEVSDSTIHKYRPKAHRGRRAQTGKRFLHNQTKELVAVDFFTVPTAAFRVLYVFLVLAHERRKVLHFNVTDSPAAGGTAQQLTEAFPCCCPPRSLLRDRDRIYGLEFVQRAAGLGIQAKLIAPRSPWQNPFVERLIGSIRRECVDHVIVPKARHLRQLLADDVDYHHRHRTHRSLDQDCPQPRPTEPPEQGNIIELPRVGGRHHRYARQAA